MITLLARLVLLVALAAACSVPASAQGNEAGAAKPSNEALADALEDEATRTRIIEQLRDVDTDEAPPADGDGDTSSAEQSGTPEPSAARRIANATQTFASSLGTRIQKAIAAFDSDDTSVPTVKFDLQKFTKAATKLLLVALATIALYFVLRAAASPLFTRIGHWAVRGAAGAAAVGRRLLAITGAFGADVVVILLAVAGGYALALFAFGEAGTIGTREALFLNAFAMIEIFKALIRMVFASRYEGLYVFAMPAEITAWWSIRLRWLAGLIGYALLVVIPIINVEISRATGALAGLAVMLAAYLYALSLIVGNRKTVGERLELRAGQASTVFFGILLRLLARTWHWLAAAYFTVLLITSQIAPDAALPYMAKASLQTAIAMAVGLLVSAALTQMLAQPMRLSQRVRQRMPALEGRLNAYVPAVLKTVRIVLLALVVVVAFDAWQVFDLGVWLSSEAGEAFVAALIRVALILLVALAFWTICASIMEARAQAPDATARNVTLMALFKNALALVVGTFTFMIVLSQIGVDIGPLIAGAGVLGLAIGFGAQKMVQDVITGVFIQIENAMNTGDVVTVAGISGTAEKLSVRSVGIRDLSGTYHVIPFSSVDAVSNYMRDFAYHVGEYRISLREDIDEAITHLRAAFEDLQADPDNGPNVLEDVTIAGVTALDDSSVNIRVMIKAAPGTQWAVGRAYNRLVKIHFDAAGIEIPFPHRTMYFGADKSGNAQPAPVRMVPTGERRTSEDTSRDYSTDQASDVDQPERDVHTSDDGPE